MIIIISNNKFLLNKKLKFLKNIVLFQQLKIFEKYIFF